LLGFLLCVQREFGVRVRAVGAAGECAVRGWGFRWRRAGLVYVLRLAERGSFSAACSATGRRGR
jgi:hypothetical protein